MRRALEARSRRIGAPSPTRRRQPPAEPPKIARELKASRHESTIFSLEDRPSGICGLNGACIGEAAIVGGQVHTVAARAVSDAILLRFPATTFSDIFAEHPQLLTTVLDDLLRRMGGVYTNLARLRRPKEPLMDVPADPLPGIAGRPRLG